MYSVIDLTFVGYKITLFNALKILLKTSHFFNNFDGGTVFKK
jgi:hypothetical protein